jgi:uncharacterized protein involved in type VI secretion and phage assembly
MRQQIGVALGIVTNLKDPQGEGRIKVKFTSFPDGGPESAWAPIAVPLAGGSRGMFFMPEKNDEVLLAFDRGDFDHPYVIGFLWNGVDKPPEPNPKNRVILTPGGHTLRFEDSDNAKKIIIRSSGGLEITLDDNAASPSIQLSGGGRSLVLKDGKVEIL